MESLLVEKLKIKDADAINQWVAEHQSDLYRFLRQLTRHTETAEDLTQQTFIKAIRSVNTFEGRCSMRTWLHRIAFNEYAAWRRRHKILAPLNPSWGKADSNIGDVDATEGLLQALHRLHPAQREAFLLFEIQEMSLEEISEVTGDPVGTIKSRLHHAREKLKRELSHSFRQVIHEH
ncbi:MAG: RNA polymerase sigma factor [Fimbriimonadaceae bacterium]|nr:RNA polymerase sigma factor [Fimbriimonadaceae bacterium]